MAEEAAQRYAVVSGANKGIGLETVKQLASGGVKVVLTARDEKKGLEALERLRESGFSDQLVVFHQLDVTDAASATSLADFIRSQFGKLDILVNNAGVGGVIFGDSSLTVSAITSGRELSQEDRRKATIETYESAQECLQINYYGTKRITQALLPLLHLSDSPTIVNVSSFLGKLEYVWNEWAKGVLSDGEKLTEERVDEVVEEFLRDFREGVLEAKGWLNIHSAYTVSKASMTAYTRILASKYPNMCINSVCPGYVKTDITANTGFLTPQQGASNVVRLALLPHDGPSGLFYSMTHLSPF